MDITTLYEIIGILSIIFAAANFVIISIAKTFWKLTFQTDKQENQKKFEKIEIDIKKLQKAEESNSHYRHNFNSVTKSLEVLISSEIKHLGEKITIQIENILDKINEKK